MRRTALTLYAVTDRHCLGGRDLETEVEHALAGGVTCVQLREKDMPEQELIAEAIRIKAICRKYGVPLILNDNYRAALAAGADGVHVGLTDTPAAEIRRVAGAQFLIGATAKTVAQAQAAEAAGADYLGVGAVFPSPTKTDAVRITPEALRTICHSVRIPAVAIGGITAENAAALQGSGAAGIAVVSALFGAADVKAAAQQLRAVAEGLT